MDPTQQPPQTPHEIVVPQPKPNYFKIFIFVVLINTLFSLISYLYLKNQLQKKQFDKPQITPTVPPNVNHLFPKPSPTISIPPDETAGWKTYNNKKYLYTFKCPSTSTYNIQLSSGNGLDKPLFQEICYENKNQITIYVYPSSHSKIEPDGAFIKELSSPTGKESVILRGFDETYFNQILSTFKFTN